MKKILFIFLCFVLCGCGVSQYDYEKALNEAEKYKELYENLLQENGTVEEVEKENDYYFTVTPTVKPTFTPTPKPTIFPLSDKSTYTDVITYEMLARYPEQNLNRRIKLQGKVTQVLNADFFGEVTARMNVDNDYNQNLYMVFDEDIIDYNLLENDEITVYGVFTGLYSYSSILGSAVTVPKIEVYIIEEKEKPIEIVPTVDDIELVKEYVMSNSWRTYHFMVIRNNGEATVEVSTSTTAYSTDGSVLALEETSVEALGEGCETLIYESFDCESKINAFETEFYVSKDKYYDSVIQNLSYEETIIENGVIVKVTNNGDIPAEFTQGYVLFFKDGKVVDYESAWFTDDDSEIKSGNSIKKQLKTYEEFDSIEFYLQGRKYSD